MKKIIFLFTYLLSINCYSSHLEAQTSPIAKERFSSEQKTWLEYKYPNRFKVSIPENWNVKEIEPTEQNMLHGFTIMAEYGHRNFSINENTRVFKNRDIINSIFELSPNDILYPMLDILKNAKIIYTRKSSLSNLDTYIIKISYDTNSKIDGSIIKSYNILYTLQEPNTKNIYTICYSSINPNSDTYEQLFHSIAKTFRLISTIKKSSNALPSKSSVSKQLIATSNNATSIEDFKFIVSNYFTNYESYLINRRWSIYLDDRKNGYGIIFKKSQKESYEKLTIYQNVIIYKSYGKLFSLLEKEIINYFVFWRTSIDEDGVKTDLYYDKEYRVGIDRSHQTITFSSNNQ